MKLTIKYIIGIVGLVLFSFSGYSQPGQWNKIDTIDGQGRFGCVGFTSIGYGYVGTGYDNNDYKRSFYSYNPTVDNWDKKARPQ